MQNKRQSEDRGITFSKLITVKDRFNFGRQSPTLSKNLNSEASFENFEDPEMVKDLRM